MKKSELQLKTDAALINQSKPTKRILEVALTAPESSGSRDAVPLLDGCATLRRNVGDRAATEGPWALEWREAGVDFLLRLGAGAERLADAPGLLLAAGAEARAWARRLAGGEAPAEALLAPQRAAAEAALAAGRLEAAAPAACRAP